jgi:hypothetical protein
MAHGTLHAALLSTGTLRRAEMALHECKRYAWHNSAWVVAVLAMRDLVAVLSGALPALWFDVEVWHAVPALDLTNRTDAYMRMLHTVMLCAVLPVWIAFACNVLNLRAGRAISCATCAQRV